MREAAQRTLQMRHFDVQLVGAWAMLNGMLSEMETGEGKSLTATLVAGTAGLAGHAVHVITEYAKWAEQEGDGSNSPFRGLDDPKVLRQSGLFATWTPDQLVEKVRAVPDHVSISFQPLLGGLTPKNGWKSLKLLEKTLPRLREAVAEETA